MTAPTRSEKLRNVVATARELKKSLNAKGFEVFRTLGDAVVLADRVRDNLIMDSGVAALTADSLGVRVTLRAQQSDFPSATPEELFERARALGEPATARGYTETGSEQRSLVDPSDPSTVLDVWYEISLEKGVADEAELESELRFALGLPKSAGG